MTLYKCECCKETKEVGKATIVHREGKWVCKEAICSCGKYMDSEPVDGIPTLRRTEQSLSKNKDRLWKDTKEKLLDGNDS
tara:strand:+ start:356 stop:595 length:240 start_codon:yes stop_codon:yes gene_type:complete